MEALTNSQPPSRVCATTDKALHVLNPSSVNLSVRVASKDFASGSYGLVNLVLEELLYNSTVAFKKNPGDITFVFNVKSLARDLNRDPRTIQEALQDLQHSGCVAIVRESSHSQWTGIRFTQKALCHPEIYFALLKKGQNIPNFDGWIQSQQSNEVFINEEVCQAAEQEIGARFASGDKLHRRSWSAMSRATRLIAETFATGRLDLVVFILQELLLNTSYAFKRTGDITFAFSAEELAEALNRSVRSIQEVFQDLERCGFLERRRGPNGWTLTRLTWAALDDSNVDWVLRTQGRNVSGFVAWLESRKSSTNSTSETRESSPTTTSETRESSPSPYKEYIKPSELKVEQSITAKKNFEDRIPKNKKIPEDKNQSQASATGNSYKFDERLAAFVTQTIHEAGFKGSIRPRTIENFDFQCEEFELKRREIQDYVDFKVWELSAVRQETYSANTVLRILTSDLVHHKAVTKNLEYLKRCEAQRMYRDQLENEYTEHERERAKRQDKYLAIPSSHCFDEVVNVPVPVELQQWQKKLKNEVSAKAWEDFLSKVTCCADEGTKTLIVTTDPFQTHWIASQYGEILNEVLGTSVLRFKPDASAHSSLVEDEFEIQLCSTLTPLDETLAVPDVPLRAEISSEDIELAPWQQKLKEAVTGSVWRMFLQGLEEALPADGRLCLSVQNEFIGQYIFDNHSPCIEKTLGHVILIANDSKVRWQISPGYSRRFESNEEMD